MGGEMGESDMERMLENFKSVSEDVKQCYPQTLLAAMTIITSQFAKVGDLDILIPRNAQPKSSHEIGFFQETNFAFSITDP